MTQDLGSPPVSETPTAQLKPYRYVIYFVSAEGDLDEATILFESIEDWIERGGAFVEGGSIGAMKAEDVVPDSPLALALNGAEQPPAAERTP